MNLSSTPMENESSIANDRKQIKIFSNHRILASLVLLMLSAFIWWNAREISFIVKLMISLVNLEGLFDGLFTSTHAQRERGKLTNDDDEKFVRAIHFCKVFFSSFLTVRHYIDVHRVRTHAHTQSGWNILCQYLVNAVKYHREISKVLFFIFGCHYPKSTTAATTTVKMNLEVNTKWLLPTLRVPAWVCECECVCRNLLLITNLSHVSTLFLPAAKMCQIHTQIDTWIRDWRETHTCRGSTRENLSLFQCVSES